MRPRLLVPLLALALGCSGEVKSAPAPMQTASSVERPREGGIRLVRSAELAVTVDDFAAFDDELRGWLADHDGYVADLSVTQRDGSTGWAQMTLRLPADQLDAWIGWTEAQVEVTRRAVRTADVTESWTDTDARLRAMRSTEARLLALQQDGTADLADVLAVEKELGRVRGDLEALQAKMRALQDQVDLATVHLEVRVRQRYASAVGSSLGADAAEAFQTSLVGMAAVGRALVIVAAALAPWAAVLGALLLLGGGLLRMFWRRFGRHIRL